MGAYPAYHRLPWYDPTRMECENKEEQTDKMLHEYLGKNEKTKVITRLQPKNSGAPVRESRIDKDTHSAMLKHYYQKQEEEKKMREDDDDSYMESEWANPKALKNALLGNGGQVRMR